MGLQWHLRRPGVAPPWLAVTALIMGTMTTWGVIRIVITATPIFRLLVHPVGWLQRRFLVEALQVHLCQWWSRWLQARPGPQGR